MPPHTLVCIGESRLRGLFSMLLADLGCRVTACDDPVRAARLCRDDPAALVVVHASSEPELVPLLQALRASPSRPSVLLLSEPVRAEHLPALLKQGIDELLFLPVNAAKCVELLRQLLKPRTTPSPAPATPPTPVPVPTAPQEWPQGLTIAPQPPQVSVPASSPSMRALLAALRDLPPTTQVVILRGEKGSEFELLAREFHRLRGGIFPCIPLLDAAAIDDETLRDAIAMARLQSDPLCTLLLLNLEQLSLRQQSDLSALLLEERRRRHRGKPVNFVLCFREDSPREEIAYVEELLFHTPALFRLPPLRDRTEDLEGMALNMLAQLTLLFPEAHVRSLENSALDWLRTQPWKGNHAEFVLLLREAVLACPFPQLSAATLARAAAALAPDTQASPLSLGTPAAVA
jgi:DNA-binding NtrC family response regulator